MDEYNSIPSCSFYGKSKFQLPPLPQVSDNSDSSDDEEEMTLKEIQDKIREAKVLSQGNILQ